MKLIHTLLAGILLGVLIFLLIGGARIIDPQYIAWLSQQDPAQHYLGWAFFKFSPWTWPFGLNPSYGLDISSSIVYSDSIPLLAFLFKTLPLPITFQYFGIWTLLCFCLQAVFAWLITSLYINNSSLKILLCLLFLFFPPMLWRVGEHAALVGHFLILAALYLALRPTNEQRLRYWLVLILVASLVHFYLLAMVLGLWLADCFDRFRNSQAVSIATWWPEILLVILLLFPALWLAGYFSVGGVGSLTNNVATGVYGVGRFNLLSVINAQGWSYVLPTIPIQSPGVSNQESILATQEGFNFLGLGNLLLCAIACTVLIKRKIAPQESNHILLPFNLLNTSSQHSHRFLFICLGFFIVFAVSNNIGIGPHNLHIPLPENINTLASIFRASGRFAWAPLYILILISALVVAKTFTKKSVFIILLSCVALQVLDTSAGWLALRHRLMNAPFSNADVLSGPIWQAIAKEYSKVLEFPLNVGVGQAHWEKLGFFASSHQMATTATYTARFDAQKIQEANQKLTMQISTGNYFSDAIYIISDDALLPVSLSIGPNDLFIRINDMNVLLPRGKHKIDAHVLESAQSISPVITKLIGQPLIEQSISFAKNQVGTLFLNGIDNRQITGWGWAHPESWGVWSEGRRASITMLLPNLSSDSSQVVNLIEFRLKVFGPSQGIQIILNDRLIKKLTLPGNAISSIELPLSTADQRAGFVRIEFQIDQPRSPQSLGLGDDTRQLGIGLMSAQFR